MKLADKNRFKELFSAFFPEQQEPPSSETTTTTVTASEDVHLRLGETDIDAVDDELPVETTDPKPSTTEETSPTNTVDQQQAGTNTY